MPIIREIQESRVLLIVFSSFNGGPPPGAPFFVKAGLESCSKIFVIDDENRKSMGGLPPEYPTFFDVLAYLKNEIQTLAPERIITLGISGGGFPAILYGHLLGGDQVVAFSPFTLLYRKEGVKAKGPVVLKKMREAGETDGPVSLEYYELLRDPVINRKKPLIEYFESLPENVRQYMDLREVLQNWNGKTSYFIHVPNCRKWELKRAYFIVDAPGVTIVEHDIDAHVVAFGLLKLDQLKDCFQVA